jgi:hypothetical protein
MSVRKNAPYADRIEEDGKVLIYEGHDIPRYQGTPDPKTVDQPAKTRFGTPTDNTRFFDAAQAHKQGRKSSELVRVYEKVRPSIWVYSGVFKLLDAWQEISNARKVFKFKLELTSEVNSDDSGFRKLEHERLIPSEVKLAVWKRDKGRCVECGSAENLHFDHIIPYSKGGSSLVAENVQLLCAKHNLEKRDNIQ